MVSSWADSRPRFPRDVRSIFAAKRLAKVVALVGVVVAVILGFQQRDHTAQAVAPASSMEVSANDTRFKMKSSLSDNFFPCAPMGGTCRCVGTLIFSNLMGKAVREINSDGEVQCTADALGAPAQFAPRMCWCQPGVPWSDDVRKGLATIVRQGLTPRVEIATEVAADCEAASDGLWHGCLSMSRRWDATVVPQVMMRAAPPEEQLDMALRQLDACHRLAPASPLRVLGVRSNQAADAMSMEVGMSSTCSVVYHPTSGALWTAKTSASHCATTPGTCTTTPCDCKRRSDRKLELHTPQGRKCWACAEHGKEYKYRVNAMAEQMAGAKLSWWPPYGINCPPILWAFMDWRMVISDCPGISFIGFLLLMGLMFRRVEELTGLIPWTRISPLFGPALKRGEVWRFFTFTFFHMQFLELFQNVLTFLDTLDVEGTPAIVLGDGSNLKCGVGAKQNFMCYPSIGIGSYHTLGVAVISTMVGGMCSTWITFRAVVTGASALGFGLSGAIVALYGLYAGAELDQTTTVQRSFQDWVYLRLIFVGFHIAMEWVRSISQRDATGLFAHNTAFVAGFAYVLYFLPPMGDGTLLSSQRPYIVPCALDVHGGEYADAAGTECIRLFSQVYEYQVTDVQQKIFMLFLSCVLFTALNVAVFQRGVKWNEAMLLGGLEVSAVCGTCDLKEGRAGLNSWFPCIKGQSNMEGNAVYIWSEVTLANRFQVPSADDWAPVVEVRCLRSKEPNAVAEASQKTRVGTTAAMGRAPGLVYVEWKDNVFLPVQYSGKSFLEIIVWDTKPSRPVKVASTMLTLAQALGGRTDFSERKFHLTPGTDQGVATTDKSMITMRFRCLEAEDFARFRERVKMKMDVSQRNLRLYQEQLVMNFLEHGEWSEQQASVALAKLANGTELTDNELGIKPEEQEKEAEGAGAEGGGAFGKNCNLQ